MTGARHAVRSDHSRREPAGGAVAGLRAHAPDDVRAAEEALMARLPDGALMQRAAAGLARALVRELQRRRGRVVGARLVLLVGGGNNGGDALYAGARLLVRGARVDAVLVSDRTHPGGLAALRAAGGRTHDLAGEHDKDDEDGEHDNDGEDGGHATHPPPALAKATALLARADLVVDGLLGIGGRGGLRGTTAQLADAMPPGTGVVAVDLPSGVDPATGATPGVHVHADLTVTFGTAKPCLLLPPGRAAAGRVELVDIGLGSDLEDREPAAESLGTAEAAALWPVPGPGDDKYSRGVLGVVAGGATYTGAAVLATGAAVRAGAGMVRYLGPAPPTDLVRARWPEVVGPGRVQAWTLGPGVSPDDDEQTGRIDDALDSGEPAVLDAGALSVLTRRLRGAGSEPTHSEPGPRLLTPHAGELARLLADLGEQTERADVEADPLGYARRAADLTGATVLLKGAVTLVVEPSGDCPGRVRAQADGPHWLATAGSGDVLAGIAGVLLAAGLDPLDAGSLAVVVHGCAGALASAGGPVSAGTVLDAVPAAVASLLHAGATALGG